MQRNRNFLSTTFGVLGILALVGWASPAASEEQVGIVMAKDADAMTLTLETGTVLQVSSRTVITGVSGERLRFAQIPAAQSKGGMLEVDGDEGIIYEATRRGRTATADRIQLLESIPD